MTNIHFYYDQLTGYEKRFVDEAFDEVMRVAKTKAAIFLRGDDSAERAVDAFARWIIESRAG